jgi:hypothetical protein
LQSLFYGFFEADAYIAVRLKFSIDIKKEVV